MAFSISQMGFMLVRKARIQEENFLAPSSDSPDKSVTNSKQAWYVFFIDFRKTNFELEDITLVQLF